MIRSGVTGQTQAGFGSVLRVRFGFGQGSVKRVNSVLTGQLTESTQSTQPVNSVDPVNLVKWSDVSTGRFRKIFRANIICVNNSFI
ncbi:hypothetical protein Hanom_Chr13g01213531 [Helianthus anomalus]